ncbi:MAG: M1 family aminopeptidase [Acidobacteriota bacterium]
MWKRMIGFEIQYRLQQPFIHIFAIAIFVLAFEGTVSTAVEIGGSVGQVARNAPYVITRFLIIFSMMGTILLTAFVATAVNRDHEIGIQQMVLATPVRKAPYLLGRFAASLLLSVIAVAASTAGMTSGSLMPFLDPARLAPFSIWPYMSGMLIYVAPNLLIVGAIMFAASTLTRRIIYAYVALIGFFTLWGLAVAFAADLEWQFLAALIDPSGFTTYRVITRYWTILEKNTLVVPITAPLVLNRLIWMGIAATILAFTTLRYRMNTEEAGRQGRTRVVDAPATGPARETPAHHLPATLRPSLPATLLTMAALDTRQVMKSLPFVFMMGFGLFNLTGNMLFGTGGTIHYPVTCLMLREIQNGYDQLLMIVLVVYAGWLVFRDRDTRIHEMTGSLPTRDWVPVASNVLTLAAVTLIALLLAMGVTIGFQILSGFTDIEFFLYGKGLFLRAFSYWMLVSALSVSLHSILNNRYLGYLAVIAVLFSATTVLPKVGVHHHLLLYATTPEVIYTDMNGYGHFAKPLAVFHLYWWAFTGLLLTLAATMRVRAAGDRLRVRLRDARNRFTGGFKAAAGILMLSFLGLGAYIYYNTNVLNKHQTEDDQDRLAADYERTYLRYWTMPRPTLTAVSLGVDLFPEERRADMRARLSLQNRTDRALSEIHVTWNPDLTINRIDCGQADLAHDDSRLGYRIYRLHRPLMPGESLDLKTDLTFRTAGFVNGQANQHFLRNGTFFTNYEYVPIVGYNPHRELGDPQKRKKLGLPEKPREPSNLDPSNGRFPLMPNGSWIQFDAVLSTSPDQTAIAPGYLIREWSKNGRRFAHYKMDRPMLNFYSVQSSRYAVKRSEWNGITIEVFYHPEHPYNVDRMIEAIQRTLAYCTEAFGPYPNRQIRVVEFPGFKDYAQAFPNTLPCSESAGFTEDVRNPRTIDVVFFITAHETAHQWWGHQVEAAYAEGANMIVESVTQYSAFMVMEKTYGPERMSRFLRHELDRYLSGRGNERKGESPLIRVDSSQPYIFYSKGGLAMLALKEAVGEAALNRTLRAFLERWKYSEATYALSNDLYAALERGTPEQYRGLLHDLFQDIILYDLRTTGASAASNPNGTWVLRQEVKVRKIRADGLGKETDIPCKDEIELGVYGTDPHRPLVRERRTLEAGTHTLSYTLREKPLKAGIDPRHLLIDRVPSDNAREVRVD